MMMPVAYTVGPLIAGLIFALYSYKILFICIGVVMAFAITIALGIKKPRKV
jgi:MFS family permease